MITTTDVRELIVGMDLCASAEIRNSTHIQIQTPSGAIFASACKSFDICRLTEMHLVENMQPSLEKD